MATPAERPVPRGGEPDVGSDDRPVRYSVRPAGPKDAASFLELWRTVVAERRFVRTEIIRRPVRYYRRQFRRSWNDSQVSLVAVEDDRVIGHLHAAREDNPVNRHIASLGMAVARDRRGMGVGSALMAELIRWAREMAVEKLALSVYPDNAAARALYRKFGFREEGRLTGHSKKSIGYRDEIVMGLWVHGPPPGVVP